MTDKLSDAITALLPTELAVELRNNIDALVRSNFDSMNLVTREQFEVQEKVLHRTRERLEAMEKELKELEMLLQKYCAETGKQSPQ